MRRNTRRRPTGARRATSAAVALILGGGGLVAVNVYASATESGSTEQPNANQHVLSSGAGTIDCPDVGSQLTAVPDPAREEVDKELATLDQQIAEAYQRLQNQSQPTSQSSETADSAIMKPLTEYRAATIDRIVNVIDRDGDRPQGLEALATCTLRPSDNQSGSGDNAGQGAGGQSPSADPSQGNQQNGNGGQAGNGPVAADFADINSVQSDARTPRPGNDASRGDFTTSCGVNANGLFNSDNVIVAPGVTNGAHHFHDYVGNQANNAFASDDDLANADTSCENKGDKSTYYWPVLRLQNGTRERDAEAAGGGTEGNAGEIVTPAEVTLTFVGNPRSKVTAMPRLLRIITGDAKAFVNGNANANASWSCTGFEDRQLKDKYPICPKGSDVVRTFKFQSCWDGQNTDSANHRTHVAFADAEGNCANGFRAIPQLVQRIVYDVDAPSLEDGGRTTPLFAVDSFPEQLHKPVTDHGDFINVFDDDLMREMVGCINEGRQCGSGADPGPGTGAPTEPSGTGEPQQPSASDTPPEQQPSASDTPQQPTPTQEAPSDGTGDPDPGNHQGEQTSEPTADTPATEPAGGASVPVTAEPKADVTASASHSHAAPSSQGGSHDDHGSQVGTAEQTPPAVGTDPSAAAQTEPQAVQGGLAATGTQLWPAAIGAIFLIAGFVLLHRIRRTRM